MGDKINCRKISLSFLILFLFTLHVCRAEVLFDDAQTSFWKKYPGRQMADISISNDAAVAAKGKNSLKVEIKPDRKGYNVLLHKFSPFADFSSMKCLTFYFHGQNTGITYRLELDTKGKEAQDTLSFPWKDDSSGWTRQAFLFKEGRRSKKPDLSRVNAIRIFSGQKKAAETWWLDRMVVSDKLESEPQITTVYQSKGMKPENIKAEMKKLKAVKTGSPPVIDGKLGDACWQKAAGTNKFYLNMNGCTPAKEKTEVRLCYDDKALYVAFKCYDSRMDEISAQETRHDGKIYHDDCVELFLKPEAEGDSYYHFMVNPIGTYGEEEIKNLAWNGKWSVKTAKQKDCWTAEMAVPFASLRITPDTGSVWKANFCREQKRLVEDTAWSATLGAFATPSGFGELSGLDADFSPYFMPYVRGKIKAVKDELKKLEANFSRLPSSGQKQFTNMKKGILDSENEFLCLVDTQNNGNKWRLFYKKLNALEEQSCKFSIDANNFLKYSAGLPPSLKLKKPDYGVGIASNLRKLLPNKKFTGKFNNRVNISAARGEYEGFQIAIIPFFENKLENVSLEINDLRDKNGDIISKSNVECKRVGYVKTRRPKYFTEHVGYWPDPLLPLGIKDNSVGKIKMQPYWITIKVPKGAAPGNYFGKIVVKPKQYSAQTVKVALKVYDFDLPDKNHLEVFSNLYIHQLRKFYKAKISPEIFRKFGAELLRHRIGPGLNTSEFIDWKSAKPNYAVCDENLAFFFAKGMGVFGVQGSFPYFHHSYCDACDKAGGIKGAKWYFAKAPPFLQSYASHLREKGRLEKAFCWIIDEPFYKNLKYYSIVADMVRKAAPGLKRVAPICLGMLREGRKESPDE
ncbi:MAG: glycoside hydrolase domain-containing protein, partial [Victivallaceae bacterium]